MSPVSNLCFIKELSKMVWSWHDPGHRATMFVILSHGLQMHWTLMEKKPFLFLKISPLSPPIKFIYLLLVAVVLYFIYTWWLNFYMGTVYSSYYSGKSTSAIKSSDYSFCINIVHWKRHEFLFLLCYGSTCLVNVTTCWGFTNPNKVRNR